MYARIAHSRIEIDRSEAIDNLRKNVVPRVRQMPGLITAYWLEPLEGRGMAVLLYDTKEAAESSRNLGVGDHPSPGVTVERVEIREVVASTEAVEARRMAS
jgi:hypothetical protein